MHLDSETARRFVLEQTGFDLYQSPRFIEYLVCRVAGLNQTAKTVKWDGVDANGVKIEIKHAVVITGTKRKGKEYLNSRFCFAGLQGTRRTGKEADVFVLVGYDFTTLRFFVIPATIVGKRRMIDIFIGERLYRNTGKWLNYETAIHDLSMAISQAAHQNLLAIK